jgi:hypothetical protein
MGNRLGNIGLAGDGVGNKHPKHLLNSRTGLALDYLRNGDSRQLPRDAVGVSGFG